MAGDLAAGPNTGLTVQLCGDAQLLDAFTEPEWRERVSRHITRRAARRTSRGALERLTTVVRGRPQITENSPFRVHLDEGERDHALRAFDGYRQTLDEDRRHLLDRFHVVDVVRQVVGVGVSACASTCCCSKGAAGTTRSSSR
jgi:hypothetical protein